MLRLGFVFVHVATAKGKILEHASQEVSLFFWNSKYLLNPASQKAAAVLQEVQNVLLSVFLATGALTYTK